MLSNLFNNVNIYNKLFTIPDTKILKLSIDKENLSLEESEKKVFSIFEKSSKKVIIKAFSFQPNLNGYGVIIKERKEDLKKGIEKIKLKSEIKFVVDGKDKYIQEELKTYGDVIRVSSVTDLYKNKLISKAYGESKNDVAIYDLMEIVTLGQALNKKEVEILTTIHGNAVDGGKVISIKNGTTYREIFENLKGNYSLLKKVIDGGSINGTPIYDLDSPIKENSNGILFLTEKDSPSEEAYSCIRCGKCLRACPEGLNPIKLVELYKMKEKDEFIKFGGEKCIECGLCSFVCPSKIEIAQSIKTAKTFK
ncbi:Electron transport complex subunit RsxC [bioreactor metagenome]|uniref:Electron transport complex subunit RsxC n=1 Tax=bioreactor metagenome TaxID=1076179 RepID=A0A644WGV6_9ZZZZ